MTDLMPCLGAYTSAPGVVRSHVVMTLIGWGLIALAETAEIVASELATNAVQAVADPDTVCVEHPNGLPRMVGGKVPVIAVRLRSDGMNVLIEVWDPDEKMPEPRTTDLDDESGRGLVIVGTLADDYGFDRHADGGKITWALLRLPGSPDSEQPPAAVVQFPACGAAGGRTRDGTGLAPVRPTALAALVPAPPPAFSSRAAGRGSAVGPTSPGARGEPRNPLRGRPGRPSRSAAQDPAQTPLVTGDLRD